VDRYINIYTLDRHYGGPEEGGWWYDSGTPVASLPLPDYRQFTAQDAQEAVDALRQLYTYRNRVGSVLYPEDGYDYSVVLEEEPAKAWPEERPHYE
jgi:hypothetical protein